MDEFVRLWELNDINNLEADIIIWTRTANGEYSAKSAYDMQFEGGLLSVLKDGLEGVGSFKMQVFHVAYAIEQGVDS